jgi:hypothetical protein
VSVLRLRVCRLGHPHFPHREAGEFGEERLDEVTAIRRQQHYVVVIVELACEEKETAARPEADVDRTLHSRRVGEGAGGCGAGLREAS